MRSNRLREKNESKEMKKNEWHSGRKLTLIFPNTTNKYDSLVMLIWKLPRKQWKKKGGSWSKNLLSRRSKKASKSGSRKRSRRSTWSNTP